MFNKITIIGVGLIGGSIGLAAKEKKLAREIVGVCRHQASLDQAKRIGAIDSGRLSSEDAVENADLVIMSAPVKEIIRISAKIIPHLKSGCILTDAGSTKQEVVNQIERVLPKDLYFVGAHPLAGSENRGVRYARANLFQHAICFLTKTDKTHPLALKIVSRFWCDLGCRVKVLKPQEHDKIVAVISHLPHLAATQLIKTAEDSLVFAASGFFDTTRIASSDAEIWTDIFLSNKKFLVQAVDKYIARLQLVRGLIAKEDKAGLSAVFKQAKALRDGLQKD